MADSEKTAAPSHEHSDFEKKGAVDGVVESVLPSTAASAQVVDPVVADEKHVAAENTSKRNSQASASDDEDDFEYPTKWKLGAITIALCLSVFCMALVSLIGSISYCSRRTAYVTMGSILIIYRTIPSLRQLFLASQISSRH